jgi:hypothetical protein
MALALLSPSTPSHRILLRPLSSLPVARATSATSFGLAFVCPLSRGSSSLQRTGAAGDVIDSDGEVSSEEPVAGWLSTDLLRRISDAADADRVLDIVAESVEGAGAALDPPECNAIVAAAFDRGNIELALSVFEAMGSGFVGGSGPLLSCLMFQTFVYGPEIWNTTSSVWIAESFFAE